MKAVEAAPSRAPWGTSEKVRYRITEILSSGYALTDIDIQDIAVEMGMSAASWTSLKVGKEIHAFSQKRGRHAPVLFVDPSLNLEKDTDFFNRLTELCSIYGQPLSKNIILALAR